VIVARALSLAILVLRNPITGIAGCCARAANGHVAAAPPSSVMIPCYEKIARHCCAAGFQFGLCLLRVSSVEEAVALFTAYAKGGDDPGLKKWAAKTLPNLERHLTMAQKLK
jgi:uncharacterized protein DUF4142